LPPPRRDELVVVCPHPVGRVAGANNVVTRKWVGDFDGDVLDDFVVRSNWGIRVIGSDGSDNLV
jgi:hypothetical protein